MKHGLVTLIDNTIATKGNAEPPRSHLGGSMIGEHCERALIYSFRWAYKEVHDGRIHRLFKRGHFEEFRFVSYLRMIGIEVQAYSQRLMYHPESDSYVLAEWDEDKFEATCDDVSDLQHHIDRAEMQGIKLKQWRISDVNGHFGGSLDGKGVAPFPVDVGEWNHSRTIWNPNGIVIRAGERFLTEFKTHNTKSFSKLCEVGVQGSKPMHYYQMQVYMHKTGLRYALYMAVNKNDDDLYIEIIEYNQAVGEMLIVKARRIIEARTLSPRVGNNASWHECKFCKAKPQCHFGAALEKNCRSCKNSIPVEGGEWKCGLWNALIPVDVIPKGCDSYSPITD